MKRLADKKRCELSFEEGQWVFVKLQPYRQHSVALRKNQKLSMRYFGPFQIIQKIGAVAYKLSLPVEAKIHPVFHVSLLKKCDGDPGSQVNSIPLPLRTTEFGPSLQPVAILQYRTVLRNSQSIDQVLVQWERMIESENSWEDVNYMKHYFPSLILEDKDAFNGECNVMNAGRLKQVPVGPKRINEERHVQRSKEADVDKLADVEASPPVIRRSNRERRRNTRLT
ncbi:Chromo domain-like protein [Dioscorea alata]|uniref:Chromo domain-like protein n=1 Tax=Dioscorea alata TaxID=55571 RepID=A0ACB7TRH8_DIOAL|nr:Chromo domain-like protein [Dioscorea alata]